MRVVLFTGKGGVGKTTTAAATAVHAARCGVKTLVLSADPAHSLGDALGLGLGSSPTEIAPSLFGQQVDPRARSEHAWRGVQDYLAGAIPTLPTSVEDVFATMAVVEAAYRSSAAGGTPPPYDA